MLYVLPHITIRMFSSSRIAAARAAQRGNRGFLFSAAVLISNGDQKWVERKKRRNIRNEKDILIQRHATLRVLFLVQSQREREER